MYGVGVGVGVALALVLRWRWCCVGVDVASLAHLPPCTAPTYLLHPPCLNRSAGPSSSSSWASWVYFWAKWAWNLSFLVVRAWTRDCCCWFVDRGADRRSLKGVDYWDD